jgi:hypothetical protein
MPNWVENTIIIKGLEIELDAIENKVRKTIVTEENGEETIYDLAGQLYPMPEEIRNLDGTGDTIRRFKDLDGNVVKVDQMTAMSFAQMNDEELIGEGFTMETLTEDELKELDEKYGAHDWYAWNNNNYGTKWGDCETKVIRDNKNTLVYYFDTAWSPSIPLTEKIAQTWSIDEIEHKYFSIENADKGSVKFDSEGRVVMQHWEELDESYYRFADDVEVPESTGAQAKDNAQEIFG